MNAYYILNNKKLDKKFQERDIQGTSKIDLLYFFTKILYWIWIPIGLFSGQSILFWILFGLGLIKFPLYHLNKRLFGIYNSVYPALSIITIITIFIYWLS